MKKLTALLLALIMVFSLAMVASADEVVYKDNTDPNQPDTNGSYKDITQVQLKNTYQSVGTNAKNPAEDFEYTIALKSYSDSGYTQQSDIPLPYFDNETDQNGMISFTEGEATAEGDTNTVLINLPIYQYVGIYTYEIKETKGNTMGVTYDENSLFLKVTVIEQEGKVRVAALHYANEDGSKTEGFTNIYSADDLSVTKKVTGNLGDLTKDFSFNVKFNVPTDSSVYAKNKIELWVNGAKTQEFYGLVDNYNMTVTLRDNQTFVFRNLPYGVTWTVTEADYSSAGYDAPVISVDNVEKYSAQDKVRFVADKIEAASSEIGKDVTAADTVVFTNNKEAEVDTGIALDSMPFVLMLAVAVIGMGAIVIGKKRYEV